MSQQVVTAWHLSTVLAFRYRRTWCYERGEYVPAGEQRTPFAVVHAQDHRGLSAGQLRGEKIDVARAMRRNREADLRVDPGPSYEAMCAEYARVAGRPWKPSEEPAAAVPAIGGLPWE